MFVEKSQKPFRMLQNTPEYNDNCNGWVQTFHDGLL
jgi:hypothetical protein